MGQNIAHDSLQVMMVKRHLTVESVYTVSLASANDEKYDTNHICSDFTNSRNFVKDLKQKCGFGVNGKKIDCIFLDYFWCQSVRMQ